MLGLARESTVKRLEQELAQERAIPSFKGARLFMDLTVHEAELRQLIDPGIHLEGTIVDRQITILVRCDRRLTEAEANQAVAKLPKMSLI